MITKTFTTPLNTDLINRLINRLIDPHCLVVCVEDKEQITEVTVVWEISWFKYYGQKEGPIYISTPYEKVDGPIPNKLMWVMLDWSRATLKEIASKEM